MLSAKCTGNKCGEPVIPQDVAVIPEILDELGGGGHRS